MRYNLHLHLEQMTYCKFSPRQLTHTQRPSLIDFSHSCTQPQQSTEDFFTIHILGECTQTRTKQQVHRDPDLILLVKDSLGRPLRLDLMYCCSHVLESYSPLLAYHKSQSVICTHTYTYTLRLASPSMHLGNHAGSDIETTTESPSGKCQSTFCALGDLSVDND